MDEPRDEQRTAAEAESTSAMRRVQRGLWSRARSTGRVLSRAVRSPVGRRTAIALSILAVTLAGVIIGVLLGARTYSDVGPFRARMAVTPSFTGGTEVAVPPLGALQLDSHDGPAHLSVTLAALDQRRTKALVDDPNAIAQVSQHAVQDVTAGITRLGLRTVAVAVLAALILSALVFRNMRRVAWSGGLALAITGGSLGLAVATVHPESIEEPRYEGLLINAPALVGDARRIAHDYPMYAEQLQRIIGNVSRIYTTVSRLPTFAPSAGTIRVLHISDLHLNPTAWPLIRTVVEQFGIQVVIDTGDITDWGSEPEASFVGSIGLLKVPYVFINGNHDSRATTAAVAKQPNAIVLNNKITTVAGLTIAGIGDPRFTPDKETSPPTGSGQSQQSLAQVVASGEQLAATIRAADRPVDIALVHDPASAGPLGSTCPLVLAGHLHTRSVSMLPPPSPGGPPTRLMVEGSTGGAGLRGLEGKTPLPLEMSVLYFNSKRALQAYDDIKVGGTGQSQVTLERHLVDEAPTTPARVKGSPYPSPTR